MLRTYTRLCIALIAFVMSPLATSSSHAEGTRSAAFGPWVDWELRDNPSQSMTLRHGKSKVAVVLEQVPPTDGEQVRVTIKGPKGSRPSVFELDEYPFRGIARLVEFDRSNSQPEVVISFYSGGAHCCFQYYIFEYTGAGWKPVSLVGPRGALGGGDDDGSSHILDEDKDGIAEIVDRDDSFLYKYTSYAGSHSPSRYYVLQNARWADVSGQPGFRHLYARSSKDLKEACGKESNSFWAAYVAEQAILGQSGPAWQLMLKCHDRKEDWGLCKSPDELEGCRTGKRAFPDVLREHLAAQGYLDGSKGSAQKSDNNCREFSLPLSNGKVARRWGPSCTPSQCQTRQCWQFEQ